MKYQFLLNYTEALIRQAAFHFWVRTVSKRFFAVLALCCGSFAYLLFTTEPGWEVGALGAILIIAMAFVALVYFVHYKKSMEKFRAMGSPVASFEVSDLDFSFSSSLGSTTLKWAAISEVWVFEDMWLFIFSKAQFSTIPLADIPDEAKDYILSRIRSSGGKVG